MKSETIYEIMLSVLSGEATAEEHRLLQDWLARSEVNKREFEQVSRLYRSFGNVACQDDSGYDVERAWTNVRRRTLGKLKRLNLKRWLPYAALVALAFSAGFYFIERPIPLDRVSAESELSGSISQPTLLLETGEQIPLKQDSFSIQKGNLVIRNKLVGRLSYEPEQKQAVGEKQVEWNRLVIPKGNAYELDLADGTHVWLNAESELSYPTHFVGEQREVRLKGEAFFDVTKNPDCPFVVHTDEVAVRVLGTTFNVSAYQAEPVARVTLVDGSVTVKPKEGEERRIVPTEQFSYDKENHKSGVRVVNTGLYTSWIKGEYLFRDATLEEILGKLLHWYDFSVVYQDERLKEKCFSLSVDRKISLDQLLELISFTSDVELEQEEGNRIYVKHKKKEVG